MHVTRQEIDALNGLITVEIDSNDYKDKVKSSLEKHRKTAKIPGFRPGHVPLGVVEKRFGNFASSSFVSRTSGSEKVQSISCQC